MEPKRFFNESSSSDEDDPNQKRIRNNTRTSFASVVAEVTAINSLHTMFSTIEPMLRRVVNEEVNRTLTNNFRLNRSQIQSFNHNQPSTLKLMFTKTLTLPIFTGTKITTVDKYSPLQVCLIDGDQLQQTSHPIKAEVVVLDGDFPTGDDNNTWTSEEFEANIVKERTGKRPLLAGELSVTVRDGYGLIGDVEFTDNSSWIRSRKFRIGVRVAGSYQGVRICEAITEAFVVKDHRGELYKKHHPPSLEDEVWRLEKISKEGVFHKKLSSEGIKTVQDFLKLSTIDTLKLRKILGPGMSDKMWEVIIKHARTCVMGNRRYIFRGPNLTILLSPICQIIEAVINDRPYQSLDDLNSLDRTFIENMVRQAYNSWSTLEKVEGHSFETPLLLNQGGEEMDQHHNEQTMGYLPSTSHMGSDDHWQMN